MEEKETGMINQKSHPCEMLRVQKSTLHSQNSIDFPDPVFEPQLTNPGLENVVLVFTVTQYLQFDQ